MCVRVMGKFAEFAVVRKLAGMCSFAGKRHLASVKVFAGVRSFMRRSHYLPVNAGAHSRHRGHGHFHACKQTLKLGGILTQIIVLVPSLQVYDKSSLGAVLVMEGDRIKRKLLTIAASFSSHCIEHLQTPINLLQSYANSRYIYLLHFTVYSFQLFTHSIIHV